MKSNPGVEINYIGKSTFEALETIVSEPGKMDGWIAADETAADMLKRDYGRTYPGNVIIESVTPIITTPLVLVGWDERISKIANLDVNKLYEIVSKGKDWGQLGGDKNWGFFNFSHTDPVNSNSGIQFISLLIHNYYNAAGNPKKELKVEDIANDRVLQYVKLFEKNTAQQVDGSGKFMDMLVQFGPSRYDIGAIYESYALANLKNAQGRWGKLKIIYPNPTIWSNRPIIILKNADEAKIKVLNKFRDYLLSTECQKKAMLEGYRPANTTVSDLSVLEKEYSSYGFKKDVPQSIPSLNLESIDNIRNLIKRVSD